jgi:phytoene dehydrogenase-like protein
MTDSGGHMGRWDVVIVGAGHNGLVAAAYLARAGQRVLMCESTGDIGGATTSVRAFEGLDARLSRYSYLVSLLPDQIVSDLGLRFATRSRGVASYTPAVREGSPDGLLIRNGDDALGNEREIERFTSSSSDARAWEEFYADVARFAQTIAPTLLEPLQSRSQMRARLGDDQLWDQLVENPIGAALKVQFANDVVRGVVATDALIGTFADLDADMSGNRCFLYHVVGNGTGEWKVPVGGMGALVAELERVAREAGVQIRTDARVVGIEADGQSAAVQLADGEVIDTSTVLVNAAPSVLNQLLGRKSGPVADGPQIKVNMLLERLPDLKSGLDPAVAFAGTFHINQSYDQLQTAHKQAAAGEFPSLLPAEVYCHSLTDDSILGSDLRARGFHTLTLFGLHTPAVLFDADNDRMRQRALEGAFASLNEHLVEPIQDCLAIDSQGRPCAEAKTPLDLEQAIGLPRGNIFHRELSWPFTDDEPGRWGTETDLPNVFICGAGAIRGGGVSGIPGHNAAQAALAFLAPSRN